ncbi:MAG: dicarboxylate/amino acid:cation symporter, partial [Firmicutes bacterium]|nr:dicarboxylate/amino acid:cation symporter [Bacillota bacterium]
IMLAMVLESIGLPVEGIAIIAGVDKIFDMGRTTLNITGDATCAIWISKLEQKKKTAKIDKAA